MSEEKSTPRQEEKFFVEVKGFIFEESTPARKIAYIDAQYDRASGEWLLGGVLLRYGDLIAFNQGKYVVFSREFHKFQADSVSEGETLTGEAREVLREVLREALQELGGLAELNDPRGPILERRNQTRPLQREAVLGPLTNHIKNQEPKEALGPQGKIKVPETPGSKDEVPRRVMHDLHPGKSDLNEE